MKGVFYVKKVNNIAQFGYGKGMSFDSKEEAEQAANAFIAKRKDKKQLSIHHIELG